MNEIFMDGIEVFSWSQKPLCLISVKRVTWDQVLAENKVRIETRKLERDAEKDRIAQSHGNKVTPN